MTTTSTRPKARLVNEKNKVTILQRIGVVMIIAGLLGLIISLFFHSDVSKDLDTKNPVHPDAASAPIAAISFFITMLGVAFAFPTMLRGKEGISTMRIVVFMMANVICMLLIKFGWQVNNLQQIGLNEWWMGVIAFVFGAKATQSYFESKLAVPQQKKEETFNSEASPAPENVAKQAIAQHEAELKNKFPNIVSVSDAVKDNSNQNSHVIALYLNDHDDAFIPKSLNVKTPSGEKTIATEIILGGGKGRLHLSQGDFICDENNIEGAGSICCSVRLKGDDDFLGVVTAAHIYTRNLFDTSNNGLLPSTETNTVLLNKIPYGKWYYKQLSDVQDLIVAQLIPGTKPENIKGLKYFNDKYYVVTDADIQKTKVTILTRGNRLLTGYILDQNIGYPIIYGDGKSYYKKNIILIGDTPNRQTAGPVTVPGDSGSCVYITNDSNENFLVGILLGGDENFSFVLPVRETLSPIFTLV